MKELALRSRERERERDLERDLPRRLERECLSGLYERLRLLCIHLRRSQPTELEAVGTQKWPGMKDSGCASHEVPASVLRLQHLASC